MRLLSLHGLSHDAWERYSGKGSVGLSHPRARLQVQHDGHRGRHRDTPARPRRGDAPRPEKRSPTNTSSGWATSTRSNCHRSTQTESTRGTCFRSGCVSRRWRSIATASSASLGQAGVSCSVHWRPLHLHPYYEETFGWQPADLPVASAVWARLVSLPIFSTMASHEIDAVVDAVRAVCGRSSRRLAALVDKRHRHSIAKHRFQIAAAPNSGGDRTHRGRRQTIDQYDRSQEHHAAAPRCLRAVWASKS